MEEYKIIETNEFSYLVFNALEKFDILNAIILRKKYIGFSRTVESEIREKSLRLIKEEFNITNVVQPHQNHTDIITTISDINNVKYSDAVILDKKQIATLIVTADCMPIIVYDKLKNIAANIHAGWRGVVNKITEKTINKMIKEYNSKPENLIVCIGPCIREKNFLVNEDVVNLYKEAFKDEKSEEYIKKTNQKNEKGINYSIDNAKLMISRLKKIGINLKNIHDCKICTVEQNKDWYSYRVEGKDSNRIGIILMIK